MQNPDECGLYWKGIPIRILAFEKEKYVPRHKSPKAHLMAMCCANGTGNPK
jgi:hypothetical protein